LGQNLFLGLQIGLDVVLLFCLVMLIYRLRGSSGLPSAKAMFKTTEEFLAASEELAARFEQNLREKRALVSELANELDRKTQELKALLAQAEEVGHRLNLERRPVQAELSGREGQVLSLAKQGLVASQIATRLRLPRGEVETILSLNKTK
jgi:ATP/maltotriose-dependent transcriptional regulator MalT